MTRRITRRAFNRDLAALVGSLVLTGLPVEAGAQQPALPRRIGVLLGGLAVESQDVQQFRQGLADAGYAEGRDVVIEWRSADGDYARVPQLAADLVRTNPHVIVVENTVGAQAVKRATSTIPIVMALVGDPVGSGLVSSLGRPGGNVTGLSLMTTELSVKRLQLLKEAIPSLARVGVLWNPDSALHRKVANDLTAKSSSLPVALLFAQVRTREEIGPAVQSVTRAHAQALYIIEDLLFSTYRTTLFRQASKFRLPVIYGFREFASEGALICYGPSLGDLFRRSAGYVDRILKGARPADLPVEQPTKFELVVNLKTAKALRLAIPESIMLRADEVIR